MQWYPPEGNSPTGLSPRAQWVVSRLAEGTFEIDFARLADAVLEQIRDGIPDCETPVATSID